MLVRNVQLILQQLSIYLNITWAMGSNVSDVTFLSGVAGEDSSAGDDLQIYLWSARATCKYFLK